MRFVTVRELRNNSDKIWKDLKEEQELIITSKGKPIALLTPISESSLEETLKSIRKSRAINAVKNMQHISMNTKNIDMNVSEINNIISETRNKK